MTRVEAAQNHDLIQGMCFIKGKTLNIVYDLSNTHYSFLIIVFNTLTCQSPF